MPGSGTSHVKEEPSLPHTAATVPATMGALNALRTFSPEASWLRRGPVRLGHAHPPHLHEHQVPEGRFPCLSINPL